MFVVRLCFFYNIKEVKFINCNFDTVVIPLTAILQSILVNADQIQRII